MSNMEPQFMEDLFRSVSEFSKATEDLLLQIERGDVKGEDNLRQAYRLRLSHIAAGISAELCESAVWNTKTARNRLYASWFMTVHIEPILALADEYSSADLRTEHDEIMRIYNFALGMRRLYRKISEP